MKTKNENLLKGIGNEVMPECTLLDIAAQAPMRGIDNTHLEAIARRAALIDPSQPAATTPLTEEVADEEVPDEKLRFRPTRLKRRTTFTPGAWRVRRWLESRSAAASDPADDDGNLYDQLLLVKR